LWPTGWLVTSFLCLWWSGGALREVGSPAGHGWARRNVGTDRLGVSGGGETWHLLLGLGLIGRVGLGEDQRHRLDGQISALNQPLVVLL
jgi:hypothetical protein